jgi:disulfide bond formation protein DsbB
MKTTQSLLLFIACVCIALLGGAVYFQIVEEMAPCPWCVIQRYVFALIAIICLIFALVPHANRRLGATLAAFASLIGTGCAAWLLWTQAHPGISCGIDPMETTLNHLLPAQWFPTLFFADGLCTTLYDNIMGLSIAQWSFVAFIGMTIVLFAASVKHAAKHA